MTNARALLGWSHGYHTICREERNVVAMLYHLLMEERNLARFLDLAGCELPIVPDEVGLYFEYAFLRDLWSARVRDDAQVGRTLILDLLRPRNAEDLARMSIAEFNTFFGAVPQPSRDFIQSPFNWSLDRFAANIPDADEFLRVCRFKWAFNAKPDLVVHVSHDAALCVEAKFASGEGHYPSKASEKAEFARRGLPLQRQTDLQRYILRELLGLDAEFVFLVEDERARSATHKDAPLARRVCGAGYVGVPDVHADLDDALHLKYRDLFEVDQMAVREADRSSTIERPASSITSSAPSNDSTRAWPL